MGWSCTLSLYPTVPTSTVGLTEILVLPSHSSLTSSLLKELKAMFWSQRPEDKATLFQNTISDQHKMPSSLIRRGMRGGGPTDELQ